MTADLPVGRSWPAHDYEVGREKIREYSAAIGARAPFHRDHEAARELGFGAVVAPPTFAAVYVAASVATVMFDPAIGIFDPKVGLAGYRFVQRAQEFQWLEPVCAGDRLTTVASLLEAGERDGSQFRVFGSETVRNDGALVLRGRYEGVVPGGARRKPAALAGEEKAVEAERSTVGDLEIGDALPSLRATPDRYAPVRYAGASGDFTPFHLDAELARAIGLPGVILHGLYTYAQLARALVEPFGGDPRVLRRLSARFRRPALPEVELISSARVTAAGEGVARLACRVGQGGKDVLDAGEAVIADVGREVGTEHQSGDPRTGADHPK